MERSLFDCAYSQPCDPVPKMNVFSKSSYCFPHYLFWTTAKKPWSNLIDSDGSLFFSTLLDDKLCNSHFIGEENHFFSWHFFLDVDACFETDFVFFKKKCHPLSYVTTLLTLFPNEIYVSLFPFYLWINYSWGHLTQTES